MQSEIIRVLPTTLSKRYIPQIFKFRQQCLCIVQLNVESINMLYCVLCSLTEHA